MKTIFNILHKIDLLLGYKETHYPQSRCFLFKGFFTGFNESESGSKISWIFSPSFISIDEV